MKELKPGEVFLDRTTGDFYELNQETNTWSPTGNTGVLLHSSTKPKNYGARNTAARGSGRKPRYGLEGPVSVYGTGFFDPF